MKWEYNVIDFKDSSEESDPESMLNSWGKEGWELVSITACPGYREYSRYFFKRPLDGPSTDE